MKIAVLGTKMVGAAIATKLLEAGHEVAMGSRTKDSDSGRAWLESLSAPSRERGRLDTFAGAAQGADLLVNCTGGKVSVAVLESIAPEDLRGKILMDISNPLDFDRGMPPSLSICNTSSLGERIQEHFPELKVVKTLNTVNAHLMVTPDSLPEATTLFVSGNDAGAKDFITTKILREAFGWRDILDLGDITTSRGTEMYLPLWIRMWGALKTPAFNVKIVRADAAPAPAP